MHHSVLYLPLSLGGLARQLSAIKFSVLPDLCDKECHRLLNKYMPVSVKRSKMQQKLFIG